MTPDTSASPRGLHLPVFSFDAIHRPFCASPLTTTTSTPWPSSSSSSLSASSSPWSVVDDDTSSPRQLPHRGLVLPALTDPEPPVLAAAALPREEATNVVRVGVDEPSRSSSPAVVAVTAEEESADCALLSLVALSCSTSPAASPVRQPSTARLLRAASACEKFAELRKKRKREGEEDAVDDDHHDLTGRPPRTHGGLQDGADHPVGDRAHKRRRVERPSVIHGMSGVECGGQAHNGDAEEEADSTGRATVGERLQEAQQGTEESDVEADHASENGTDRSNVGGDQDDVDSEAAGEDHYDERGLGILMLGEESAEEEEEDDDDNDEHALDESRRQLQHQHQKTVMVMEVVTETTSPHPPVGGRRGPRRIWASISARELEGLRLYTPMPTGSRRTRVSRMGLHHFFHRAHAARPSTLTS